MTVPAADEPFNHVVSSLGERGLWGQRAPGHLRKQKTALQRMIRRRMARTGKVHRQAENGSRAGEVCKVTDQWVGAHEQTNVHAKWLECTICGGACLRVGISVLVICEKVGGGQRRVSRRGHDAHERLERKEKPGFPSIEGSALGLVGVFPSIEGST